MKCVLLALTLMVVLFSSCSILFGPRGPRTQAEQPASVAAQERVEVSSSVLQEPQFPFLPRWLQPRVEGGVDAPLAEAIEALRRQDAEQAAILLQQLRASGRYGEVVTALHAWALVEAGEVNAASAVAQEGILQFGATPALGYVMAEIYELQQQPAQALALYRDLLTLDGSNLAMLRACARTAVAARRGTEALQYLDRWLLAAPLDIDGKRLRARALQLCGRPDDALALYNQLVQAWPQDYVLLAEMADVCFEIALQSKEQKHLELAAELLQRLTEADPQHASAFYELGLVESELQRPQMAMTALRRCLELEPRHVEAGLRLSALFVAAGQADEGGRVLLDLLRQPLAAKDVERVQSALLEQR